MHTLKHINFFNKKPTESTHRANYPLFPQNTTLDTRNKGKKLSRRSRLF